MGLRRGILQASLVLALGVFGSADALAQSVTTRLVTAGGAATSATIQPGGTVSIDVRLDATNVPLIGTGFTLSETTPACSGFLSVTGRSFTGSPFNDTNSGTADSVALVAPGNLLDPSNNANLGRSTINLVGTSPATQSNILAVNLTLTSSASTPLGTCTIVPTPGVSFATQANSCVVCDGSDDQFNDYDMSTATPFSIIVGAPVTVTTSGTGTGTVTADTGAINCTSGSSANCSDIYPGGTVTLTATPAGGSTFGGFSGGGCTTSPCTVTVTAATTVNAQFNGAPVPRTLTVNKAGAGTGTVTSDVGAINCGATCSDSYNSGTVVTLTATPAAGSAFTGWSGGGCSGTGTCAVTLNANTTVTATFVPTFALTVTPAGTGTGTVTSNVGGINCGATCSGTVNAGTQVTLTAAPAAGSVFTGFTGGGCSGSSTTCVVTVNAATSVTATFVPSWILTVTKSGGGTGTVTSNVGGINCGATCTSTPRPDGSTVTLTATAASNSIFTGWSGGGCSGTGTCTVTMTADTTVDAAFAPAITLTVSKTGSGTITSDVGGLNCGNNCAVGFLSGSTVTLTATPGSGATFNGFGGACSGTGPCTLTITQPTTVTAAFTGGTPIANAIIPTLSEWGLMLLTLMVGVAGAFAYRRRF